MILHLRPHLTNKLIYSTHRVPKYQPTQAYCAERGRVQSTEWEEQIWLTGWLVVMARGIDMEARYWQTQEGEGGWKKK